MTQVNIHQAKAQLSDLIKRAMRGEEIIIARDNMPVVKLISIQKLSGKRRLGTAIGLFELADDFNEPLKDFEDYM